jgi:hypothetical protein
MAVETQVFWQWVRKELAVNAERVAAVAAVAQRSASDNMRLKATGSEASA